MNQVEKDLRALLEKIVHISASSRHSVATIPVSKPERETLIAAIHAAIEMERLG